MLPWGLISDDATMVVDPPNIYQTDTITTVINEPQALNPEEPHPVRHHTREIRRHSRRTVAMLNYNPQAGSDIMLTRGDARNLTDPATFAQEMRPRVALLVPDDGTSGA